MDRAALELGLEALVQENELIVCACGGRDFVFLPELYAAETYIAGRMARSFPPTRIWDSLITGRSMRCRNSWVLRMNPCQRRGHYHGTQ